MSLIPDKMVPFTASELVESAKKLQGKTLQDLFTKEQLEEIEKDYYVSFNCGILSFGAKKIHISKRDEAND